MKLLLPLFAIVSLSVAAFAGEVDPASLVGKPLPALTGLDFFKQKPDLKGKPVLVEFWATWCPPCRQTIPHLNKIYEKLHPKGFEVVGITDEPNQTIRSFVKSVPIDYPVASDRRNLGAEFGITSIPHAFLVDKSGKIVWQGHPMTLEEKQIEDLL